MPSPSLNSSCWISTELFFLHWMVTEDATAARQCSALYAERWLKPGSFYSLSIEISYGFWLCPSVFTCQMASRGASLSLGMMELLLQFGWDCLSQMILKESTSPGNVERKWSEMVSVRTIWSVTEWFHHCQNECYAPVSQTRPSLGLLFRWNRVSHYLWIKQCSHQ